MRLEDDNGDARSPSRGVVRMEVLTDGALEETGLWVGAITLAVRLPLAIPADCVGPLDDFLQVRATFDIEGGEPLPDIADAGTAGDLPAIVDLPQ